MTRYRVRIKVTQIYEQEIDVEADSVADVRHAFDRLYNADWSSDEPSRLIRPDTLGELEDIRRDEDVFDLLESHDEVQEIIELED